MASLAAARPILRASATSAFCMAVGDVVCQGVQERWKRIDLARVGRFAVVGAALHGPFFFTGMALLDRRFGAAKNLRTAMVKSAVGQLTLFPVYTSLFFTSMGTLEGIGLRASLERLAAAFPTTAVTGTLFWPAANLVTFQLAPAHRVAFLGVCGIMWNSALSFFNSSAAAKQQGADDKQHHARLSRR